jgi:lysophospholipid acyltransferase (LPLAT)-like uncharacterized protein
VAPFLKNVLQNESVVRAVTFLASLYMRFVFKTTRWTYLGQKHPEAELARDQGFIVSFWHQRLFMGVFGWVYKAPFSMIISAHKDGRLIAETVARFGILWIAGSSSKGGAQALRQAVRCLKNKEVVGITPDGPRGPRHQVQPGTIVMAQLAKVKVFPFTFSMTHCIHLKTWDQFVLPLPFGQGVIAWDEGLDVVGLSIENGQELLAEKMQSLQELADAHLRRL